MTTTLAPTWVPEGFQVLDAEPLGIKVMAQDYVFTGTEVTTADLSGDGAVGVGEMTATGVATRNAESWTLNLDDLTTTDTSGVTEVDGIATGGVWLYRLADDKLIGFSSDPQPGLNPYAPTWPDGFYDLPIASIDAVLAGLRTDVDTALAVGGGGTTDQVLLSSAAQAEFGFDPDQSLDDLLLEYLPNLIPLPESLAESQAATQALDGSGPLTIGQAASVLADLTGNVPSVGTSYGAVTDHAVCVVTLRQDATGGRTVPWTGGPTFIWAAGTAPTLTTTGGKSDVLRFTMLQPGGGVWLGEVLAQAVTV